MRPTAAVYRPEFDWQAMQRTQLVPCHADFHATIIDLIPFAHSESPYILDLGSGAGEMSALLAKHYPNARLTLCDQCEDQLQQASERLPEDHACCFYRSSYGEVELKGSYDVIVSVFALKQHPVSQQQKLLTRLYENLNPGGLLIIGEQVHGGSDWIEQSYRHQWLVQAQRAGASEDVIAAAMLRLSDANSVSLDLQMAWLKEIGYSEVNSWYQNFSFAVYSGMKPF